MNINAKVRECLRCQKMMSFDNFTDFIETSYCSTCILEIWQKDKEEKIAQKWKERRSGRD